MSYGESTYGESTYTGGGDPSDIASRLEVRFSTFAQVEGGGGVPPTALQTATPLVGTTPLEVSFDGSSSTDDRQIVSWDWDFGDTYTAEGPVVSHTYGSAGTYVATLTVTDDEGFTDTVTETIEAVEPMVGPVASARFKEALRYSHRAILEADVIDSWGNRFPLSVVSGTLTIDHRNRWWRALDLTAALDEVGTAERKAIEALSLSGGEVVLRAGVTFEDGTRERVQLCRLRIESFERTSDSAEVQIAAFDYMALLDDHPVTPATGDAGYWNGTNGWMGLVQGLVQDTLPALPKHMNPPVTASEVINTHNGRAPKMTGPFQKNRIELIEDWAKANGCQVVNLTDGRFHIRQHHENGDLGKPEWTMIAGEDNGFVVSLREEFTRSDMFNAVELTFENPDSDSAPIRAFAVDDDPLSPTYWNGPFGRKVKEVSDVPAATVAAAQAAAISELRKMRGTTRGLRVTGLRYPTLVPGNVIEAKLPDVHGDLPELWEVHEIESVVHDLAGATVEVETRWIGDIDETFRQIIGWV